MSNKKPLSAKDKKMLEKKRRDAAKEAKKYHKSQGRSVKSAENSSEKRRNIKNPNFDNNKKSLTERLRIVENESRAVDELNNANKSKSSDRATDTVLKGKNRKSAEDLKNSIKRKIKYDEKLGAVKDSRNKAHKNADYDNSEKDKKESNSRIVNAFNKLYKNQKKSNNNEISREEKFIQESEEKIQNLAPRDFQDGGYIVDEYGERKKQERRAKEIREQESEVINRPKKPFTAKELTRKNLIMYGSILLCVLVVGIVLSFTVLFKTQNIVVEGDEYYYDDQIIAFSNVEKNQNIFIATMFSTPQNIVDNLPYCEYVSISFSIPDTINIKVKDAVPSYIIGNSGQYYYVSARGRILECSNENRGDLPELTCDELQSTKIGDYVSFSNNKIPEILEEVSVGLDELEVQKITGFDVTDTANITLEYDNRIKINLGLPEDIKYKIQTAMVIINEKLDPNNTGVVSGTLDVSGCNTTKISHYKPDTTSPTIIQATTETGVQPTDAYGNYIWNYDNSTTANNYLYTEPTSNSLYNNGYDTNNGVGNNTIYGENNTNTYNDTYSANTYGENTYW